jgi:hypothetical protein
LHAVNGRASDNERGDAIKPQNFINAPRRGEWYLAVLIAINDSPAIAVELFR